MTEEEVQPVRSRSSIRSIILSIISGLVVFASIGYWMLSVTDTRERINVVVAAHDISAPHVLVESDLRIAKLIRGDLPKTAFASTDGLIGSTLITSLSEKEIVTTRAFVTGVDARSESLLISDNALGFSLPVQWLAGTPPEIEKNDVINILASTSDSPAEEGTILVAEGVRVLKVERGKEKAIVRMLLDVQMFQAAQILQAHANRLALAIVVEPLPRQFSPEDEGINEATYQNPLEIYEDNSK